MGSLVLPVVGFGYEDDSNHAEATADMQDGSSFFFALCFRCVLGHNRYQTQRWCSSEIYAWIRILKSIYINVDSSHPLDIVPSFADSFRFLQILGETYHFCWNPQAALFHLYSY